MLSQTMHAVILACAVVLCLASSAGAQDCQTVVKTEGGPVGGPSGWDWCQSEGFAAAYCVRMAANKQPVVQVRGLERGRLGAKQPLDVVVLAEADVQIEMTVCDGNKRLDVGARLGDDSMASKSVDLLNPQKPKYVLHRERFHLNRAGNIEARVAHRRGDTGTFTSGPNLKRIFHVEQTHSLGIHVGFAGIMGPAVDQNYVAQKRLGSEQAEVFSRSDSKLALELVLGFTPYLFGGRPVTGCEGLNCVSPFVGVGLLSPVSNNKVEWIKGIHLGLSFEFSSSFSLALTGTVRRVSVLTKGVEVGSAVVEGSDAFLAEGMRIGWGVVLNFTPSVLRQSFDEARKMM